MPYLYELHCHTQEGSGCSRFPVEDVAAFYRHMGYSGFCITDHFTGKTTLEDSVPWKERIGHFYNIYLKAKAQADKIGLSAFFGIEYSYAPDPARYREVTGNDFLLFNLSREYYLEHPDLFTGNITDDFTRIRGDGGFIIHAHPFLETRGGIIRLLPRYVDAVEVINGPPDSLRNRCAKFYAASYNLPETAGSDCHGTHVAVMAGVETEKPCGTISELVTAIRERQAAPFVIDQDLLERKRESYNHAASRGEV
jgi:hypothetical protein